MKAQLILTLQNVTQCYISTRGHSDIETEAPNCILSRAREIGPFYPHVGAGSDEGEIPKPRTTAPNRGRLIDRTTGSERCCVAVGVAAGQSRLQRRRPHNPSFPRRRETKLPSSLAPRTWGGAANPISTVIPARFVCREIKRNSPVAKAGRLQSHGGKFIKTGK